MGRGVALNIRQSANLRLLRSRAGASSLATGFNSSLFSGQFQPAGGLVQFTQMLADLLHVGFTGGNLGRSLWLQ